MNRERVIGYAKDMGIELDSMALERLAARLEGEQIPLASLRRF